MFKKISIILFFAATVGAGHAVPLQGLPVLSGIAFAAIQENGQPCPPECVIDSMEIITYYPSPYGYYEELRGDKIIVGDTDNSHIDETHLPPSGTLTFEPKSYAQITTEGTLYEGTVYYDSFDHEFKYYDEASTWQPLGGGGGDYWKPSTATGGSNDIYSANTGNVGIGVGESETIGAKLQIGKSGDETALVIKSQTGITTPTTFNYTGSLQTYKIPDGIRTVAITAYGAQGGQTNRSSGRGGLSMATVSVAIGETLYIYVGGQGSRVTGGYNGGGSSGGSPYAGGGGGGASDIRQGGIALSNRIIVAGGGGGNGQGGAGGNGGDANGSDGSPGAAYNRPPGLGGSQTAGGSGGGDGSSGSLGNGGNGGSAFTGGGGGGGGYYGGGGGSSGPGNTDDGGGGGGGSSYARGTNISMTSGVRTGNGLIIITPIGVGNIIEWEGVGSVLGVVTGDGKVGIGTATPEYSLTVNGSAYVTSGAWTASDLRFKENILPLNNSLDKILNIQPISFDWNKSGYPDMNFEQSRQIGLVAQEVEKQIPELVHTDINGYKAVAYDKLTAVLVEAVKEQQTQMRNQQKKIEILELKLKELDEKK